MIDGSPIPLIPPTVQSSATLDTEFTWVTHTGLPSAGSWVLDGELEGPFRVTAFAKGIPEPTSLTLLGVALLGLVVLWKKFAR